MTAPPPFPASFDRAYPARFAAEATAILVNESVAEQIRISKRIADLEVHGVGEFPLGRIVVRYTDLRDGLRKEFVGTPWLLTRGRYWTIEAHASVFVTNLMEPDLDDSSEIDMPLEPWTPGRGYAVEP